MREHLILWLLSIVACSVAQVNLAQNIETGRLMTDMAVLSSDSLEGRGIGTEGGEKARQYISARFAEAGVKAFSNGWFQPFSVIHPIKLKKLHGQNVMGWIEGSVSPDEFIVVSSHYDHLGNINGEIYNGADDNASGTCALIALAEYFQRNPPQMSVILVAFDGEETGLIGSKHFVANPPVGVETILLDINLDMIGRNVSNEIYVCGKLHYPTILNLLDDLGTTTFLKVSFGHDGEDGKEDWTFSSDHANFHRAKIPFIYFGEEDHPDYHMPTDELAGIQPDFFTAAVELVLTTYLIMEKALLEE